MTQEPKPSDYALAWAIQSIVFGGFFGFLAYAVAPSNGSILVILLSPFVLGYLLFRNVNHLVKDWIEYSRLAEQQSNEEELEPPAESNWEWNSESTVE